MGLMDDLFSLALIITNSLTSVVILFSSLRIISALSHCIQCRIQWDKAEIIHREENRITTDVRELVVITTADNQANA
jgi:hypothetical protein